MNYDAASSLQRPNPRGSSRNAGASRIAWLALGCVTIVIGVTAVLGATAALGAAATTRTVASASSEASFVLRVGRVLPVAPALPWEIKDALIVVRKGRIVAVGRNVQAPPDLPMIELPDATVMPGLVAAATSVTPAHSGDESIAAGYRASDAFDMYGDFTAALSGGVTTVHLSPGDHRLVTGQGAVVKLGGTPGDRILLDRADLTINLGEAAFDPPNDVTYTTPASSDLAIPPGVRQRPSSRLGQFLALEEALAATLEASPEHAVTVHDSALAAAWRAGRPLRVQVRRSADIVAAAAFIRRHRRVAYLVGGDEAHLVADEIRRAGLPLVYEMPLSLRSIAEDVGHDPDSLDPDSSTLGKLDGVQLALSIGPGRRLADFRLVAATALRAGLSPRRVLESITRVPAEILGVGSRVGSLAPGHDADILVLTGDPLASTTHVRRVYIGGRVAFESPASSALVIHAGTIWVNEERQIHNGSILIEDGRVAAVGATVPHPPFARFVDAGADAFVTPGFVDAHGHLGLDGDRDAPGPELSLAALVGVPDRSQRRVARAGVTTVILSPYKASSQGSQVAAVKTGGSDRAARVVRSTAGVFFDMRAADPMEVTKRLTGRLEAGKKYREKWLKYEKELAEWKEKTAKGEVVNGKPKTEEAEDEEGKVDPITGTWDVTISGGPIPEPQTAKMRLRLTGSDIEGRIIVPGAPEEVKIVATLDGTHISGEIQIDTGGAGFPTIEADIVEEDHMTGVISFQGIDVDLDARRTDKSGVEFSVVRRRTRGKGGRPLPPKVDEALEPLRAVLDGKIPIIASVSTAAQIDAAMSVASSFEVPLVLSGAEEATVHAEKLKEASIGVILPKLAERWWNEKKYHQGDDLSRKGVAVAFQSDAEDGARSLPLWGLRAVERGMSPDAAIAALTTQPSRMYKLEDEIGSLEVGRCGDLVIFSGHPFKTGSAVKRVIIGGEEVR